MFQWIGKAWEVLGKLDSPPAPAPAPRRPRRPRRPKGRGFDAGRTDRLTADWGASPVSADEAIATHRRALVARSRNEGRNDPYGKQFLRLVKANVVGEGFGFQAKIRDLSRKLDKPANEAVEAYWKDWTERENCDIQGKQAWDSLQRSFINSAARDGEALQRIIIGPEAGPHQFALQVLDPELLDLNYNDDRLPDESYIKMGIECNRWGRPVAYWITKVRPSNRSPAFDFVRERVRIPASEIIHEFVPDDEAGQTRGIPWMAPSLWRLRQLRGGEEAALVNFRVGAAKVGLLRTEGGDYEGDDEEEDGDLLADVSPGAFEIIPEGLQLDKWDPAYPNGEFAPFVQQSLRGVASGYGVSYNMLANDLVGVNWSSIRAGILTERDLWKILQAWMSSVYCRRIYRAWLSVQLLRGAITVAGKPLKLEREKKYWQIKWTPRRWEWVDPQKMITAHKEAWLLNVKSLSMIIRETGHDPDEVFAEIADDRAKLAEMGIPIPDGKNASAAPGSEDPESGSEEEPGVPGEPGENGNEEGATDEKSRTASHSV